MTAKEYLLQHKYIKSRISILQAEIERLRTEAESMAINLDGMPRGSGSKDKTARLAVQLADLESALQTELSELWSTRNDIIISIGKLSSEYQTLLHKRYIEEKTWEMIAVEMHFTYQYVAGPLHGQALQALEKIINC